MVQRPPTKVLYNLLRRFNSWFYLEFLVICSTVGHQQLCLCVASKRPYDMGWFGFGGRRPRDEASATPVSVSAAGGEKVAGMLAPSGAKAF